MCVNKLNFMKYDKINNKMDSHTKVRYNDKGNPSIIEQVDDTIKVYFGNGVNAISPGAIATPIFWGGSERANTLTKEENDQKMEKLKGNLAKAVPLRKTGLAEDISEAALYLASDAGRFVTCHDLVVDGGRSVAYNEPQH